MKAFFVFSVDYFYYYEAMLKLAAWLKLMLVERMLLSSWLFET